MTAQSSRFLKVAIYVTSAAILSILINVFANAFLNKSLNSTVYYIIVIALSIASIILGVLQILPRFSSFSRLNDERQNSITSLDYSSREDIRSYNSSLENVDPALEIIPSFKTPSQDYSVKVTMKINGLPVTIESPDIGKIEDLVKNLAQDTQATNRANANPSQTAVRESKEAYETENNSE